MKHPAIVFDGHHAKPFHTHRFSGCTQRFCQVGSAGTTQIEVRFWRGWRLCAGTPTRSGDSSAKATAIALAPRCHSWGPTEVRSWVKSRVFGRAFQIEV